MKSAIAAALTMAAAIAHVFAGSSGYIEKARKRGPLDYEEPVGIKVLER